MKKEQIHLDDWVRILLGNMPGEFYVELIIRVAVIYIILVGSMRLMGKRMSSQLNRSEMMAMVSLAASIGVPVMAPDRGLIPAVISAAVIVLAQRLLARTSAHNVRFETTVQGDMSVLVEDSVMQLDKMEAARVTRERLIAELRSCGLYHLGEVKYMFMESNGKFTMIKQVEPKPGLSALPDWDQEYVNKQPKAEGTSVCKNCGNAASAPVPAGLACTNCGDKNWVQAVV